MPVQMMRRDARAQRRGRARTRRLADRRLEEVSAGEENDPGWTPARRSPWLTAVWTGAGTALAMSVVAVVAVAVCWLPVSGPAGNADSAIRAGILTFLSALHAGVTVAGVHTTLAPLGLTLLVAGCCWRAGRGLADAVHDADTAYEADSSTEDVLARDVLAEDGGVLAGSAEHGGAWAGRDRLLLLGAAQAAAFALTCALLAAFSSLGTSHVDAPSAGGAAMLLFLVSGGVAFARGTGLRAVAVDTAARVAPAVRAAGAATFVYLGAGAVLTAASLFLHRDRVGVLSVQAAGGWSGVPILLLEVLAAPNAAVAAAAYLAGPGFAMGAGDHLTMFGAAHGVVPAFPVLGALPAGPRSAGWPVLLLAACTVAVAGSVAAAAVWRAGGWRARFTALAGAALLIAVGGLLLGWLGGGSLGTGRLALVGPSPWQLGVAFAAVVLGGGSVALGAGALAGVVRRATGHAAVRDTATVPGAAEDVDATDDDDATDDGAVITDDAVIADDDAVTAEDAAGTEDVAVAEAPTIDLSTISRELAGGGDHQPGNGRNDSAVALPHKLAG